MTLTNETKGDVDMGKTKRRGLKSSSYVIVSQVGDKKPYVSHKPIKTQKAANAKAKALSLKNPKRRYGVAKVQVISAYQQGVAATRRRR